MKKGSKTKVKGTKSIKGRTLTGGNTMSGKKGKSTMGRSGKSAGGNVKYSRTSTKTGGGRTVEKGKVYTPKGSTRYKTVTRRK